MARSTEQFNSPEPQKGIISGPRKFDTGKKTEEQEYSMSSGFSKGTTADKAAKANTQKIVDKSTQSGNVRHRDYRKSVDK